MLTMTPKNPKVRILVSGINYSPNQFTRAVAQYDCEAIHCNADTSHPLFADAVIICNTYTSHQAYWDVKEDYKKQGKPIWVAKNGFSEIKDKFEAFLLEKRGWLKPEPKAEISGLQVPKGWVQEPKPEPVLPVSATPAVQVHVRALTPTENTEAPLLVASTSKKRAPAVVLCEELLLQGKTTEFIMHEISRKGLKNKKGESYDDGLVHTTRYQMKLRAKGIKKFGENHTREYAETKGKLKPQFAALAKKPVVSAPRSPAEPEIDPMALIQKIMTSDILKSDDKLSLVARVSKGELKTSINVEAISHDGTLIIVKENIFESKDKHVTVMLSKEQALLVLENLAAIHTFTSEKNEPNA